MRVTTDTPIVETLDRYRVADPSTVLGGIPTQRSLDISGIFGISGVWEEGFSGISGISIKYLKTPIRNLNNTSLIQVPV